MKYTNHQMLKSLPPLPSLSLYHSLTFPLSPNLIFSILGLRCDASDEDVKKYYRRQAMLVHPDKNQEVGADEAFKILGHAFDVLGDPEKREKYDAQAIHDAEMKDALDELGK